MSDSTVTRALLAEDGRVIGPVHDVGDVQDYLRAYYRHVADDDLVAAGPERLAAVARQQAELAAQGAQGRAIVRVQAGGDAALDPASDVIDIFTDDMPFLVDSITMELARH